MQEDQDQTETETVKAAKGSKGPTVSYELVKDLVEKNNIDIFATNAKKLQETAGHGGTGTFQKYLDILKVEHISAMQSEDVSVVPTPPTELISGLWALAYASAQAQVSKNLNRITVERDGLRLMTDSQLSDVQMYEERQDSELNNLRAEIKQNKVDGEREKEVMELKFLIERQTLNSTIDRLSDSLSELKALHIVAAVRDNKKEAVENTDFYDVSDDTEMNLYDDNN
jgi:hypothetical protein